MKNPDKYLIHPDLNIDLHGVRFPLEYLYRGLIAVGQPGSGKSAGILMPLITQILKATGRKEEEKACLVVNDPKNELAPFLAKVCEECGRADDLIVLEPGSAFFNPLASPFLSDNETVEKIISFANNTHRNGSRMARGDEMFWSNAQRSLLGALVAITRLISPGGLTFASLHETLENINRIGSSDKVAKWLDKHDVPQPIQRRVSDYLTLPAETTRPCVSTSVGNTLHFWRSEPLAQLTTPAEGRVEINPIKIIDEGGILVIGCSNASFGVSISPLLLSLKEHFFSALLSRNQIDKTTGDEWLPINQSRPVFMVCDEFQSYLTGDSSVGELVALDRLRGFRAGLIAATQNLASVHSVLNGTADATRLLALFANQIYLANTCSYSGAQASWIMGSKRQKRREISDRMSPPLLPIFRRKKVEQNNSNESFSSPRVDLSTLSAMQTGEFWMRLANGQVHHRQAKFEFEKS
jgi:hypothetical protein